MVIILSFSNEIKINKNFNKLKIRKNYPNDLNTSKNYKKMYLLFSLS